MGHAGALLEKERQAIGPCERKIGQQLLGLLLLGLVEPEMCYFGHTKWAKVGPQFGPKRKGLMGLKLGPNKNQK